MHPAEFLKYCYIHKAKSFALNFHWSVPLRGETWLRKVCFLSLLSQWCFLEELATEFSITPRACMCACVCVCVLFPLINVSLPVQVLQQYTSVIYFLLCIFWKIPRVWRRKEYKTCVCEKNEQKNTTFKEMWREMEDIAKKTGGLSCLTFCTSDVFQREYMKHTMLIIQIFQIPKLPWRTLCLTFSMRNLHVYIGQQEQETWEKNQNLNPNQMLPGFTFLYM